MLNRAGFIFLLLIGIAYGQFNIAGIWNMTNSFVIASPGCCPLTSNISQVGQWANNIYSLTINFGTGTGCVASLAGNQVIYYSSGPFTGLYALAYTGSSSAMTIAAFGFFPHNNTFVLGLSTCQYIFTQNSSANTSMINYNLQGIYTVSSSWVTPIPSNQPPRKCCLPVDSKLIVGSVSGMVTLTANYGNSNPYCPSYSLSGQSATSSVSSIGGGFIVGPYVASFFSKNNTLLLSYGPCMAYYSKSNILAIGFSIFVGLFALL